MIGLHPVIEILVVILLILTIVCVYVTTNRKINHQAEKIVLVKHRLMDLEDEKFSGKKESCGCKNAKTTEKYSSPVEMWNASSAYTSSKSELLPTNLQNEYLNKNGSKQYPGRNATRSTAPLNPVASADAQVIVRDENSVIGEIPAVGNPVSQPLNSINIAGAREIQLEGKDKTDGAIDYNPNLAQSNGHFALYDEADESSFSSNPRVNAAYTKSLLPMNGM